MIPRARNILIVGGAGFIGSHVNKLLYKRGYNTIVFDNLSTGNSKVVTHGSLIKGDLGKSQDLKKLFTQYSFDAVMHFAASTDVGESFEDPFKYYSNNVINTIGLLQAMRQASVNIMIFSSSAAIFGPPQKDKVDESHPYSPMNPYGHTKLMIEQILHNFSAAYGLKFCCLRYFNAAGGDPEGEILNYRKNPGNLIPRVLESIQNPNKPFTIFGTDYPTIDGTCIRDYIHVMDLAEAHITAMENLLNGSPSSHYNLGNGIGFSVQQVIHAAQQVTGKTVPIKIGPRRSGDPSTLIADSQLAAKELSWRPKYPHLETIIDHSWKAIFIPS